MIREEQIEVAAQQFLEGKKSLTLLKKEFNLDTEEIVNKINSLGYYMHPGMKASSVINLKNAIDEYIDYYNNTRIQLKTKWMPPSKFRETSMMIN